MNSSSENVILESEHLKKGPAVLAPNRIDLPSLKCLVNLLDEPPVLVEAAGDPVCVEIREWIEAEDLSLRSLDDVLASPGDLDGFAIVLPGCQPSVPAPLWQVPASVAEKVVALPGDLLPVAVEKPRDSLFNLPHLPTAPETVIAFAGRLSPENQSVSRLHRGWLDAGEAAYRKRPILKQHLARMIVRALKTHEVEIVDGNDGGTLSYEKLLAASMVLAGVLGKRTSRKRVGILLPPGKGGFVANVAVLLANKIPVNLNFTASRDAIDSAVRRAEIDCFVSARAFQKKLDRFEWPPEEQLLMLDEELPGLKLKIAFQLLRNKFSGPESISNRLGIPQEGGDTESVLLFTSGSSGEPKGVPLTHENILANVGQFAARLNMQTNSDKLLGCLPLFHSFGFTVTLWFPVLCGLPIVTYPSPLDPAKLASLIEEHKITLFISTPTFLRGFMRKVKPEQLASLKLAVTGAEKLPGKLLAAFSKRFGLHVHEGYGLTETSPATNLNLPHASGEDGEQILPSRCDGTVGHLLPGIAARITDPDSETESDKELDPRETGMLWLKGPNVFRGYFEDPERSREVLTDAGWFRTGDLARFNEDGFLSIEGRLSRFSKIGGEMVPHETLEQAITSVLGLDKSDRRLIAVAGVPDEQKGEALVLLAATDIDRGELREKLLAEGLPALWVPKDIRAVDEIPVLASGKLDLKGCEELARARS